ncbi:MAG: DUF460 domain-containing protein, partial [Nanoarchaeota archaeon]|nr:DUF460 domain-containing protein [Nanoarchaeota archaeon]
MHPVIVGIDPGTTSAFAVLSFDMKLLGVKSKKEYSQSELIENIYSYGVPIIVGTDKKEVPSSIKEFSQRTGAKVFAPRYDTKKGEKLHIVKDHDLIAKVKNAHETDALASAIFAYNEYKALISKIFAYVKQNNKQNILDKLLMKVILEGMPISSAAIELERKPEERPEPKKESLAILPRALTKEDHQIMLLKQHVGTLKEKIAELEIENARLKSRKIDINAESKKRLSQKEQKLLSLDNL